MDLRSASSGLIEFDPIEAMREGIKLHYRKLREMIARKYPDSPSIAMGHLYAKGSVSSDSERDIQIGNAAAVDHDIFKGFDYVALGHIHRPQRVANLDQIRYSGSPYSLSFSENQDEKSLVLLEIEQNSISKIKRIAIPKFRDLVRLKGPLSKVELALEQFSQQKLLPAFVELEIVESEYNPEDIAHVNELVNRFEKDTRFHILKNTIRFDKGENTIDDLFDLGTKIQEVKPLEIFKTKIENIEDLSFDKDILLACFNEIMEEAYTEEG